MGKKAKKTRNTHKENRVSSGSHQTTPVSSNQPSEIVGDDGVLVLEERKTCTHIEKAVVLDKLSLKFTSPEAVVVKCEYCREVANDRRASSSKGRSKHGKKKGVVGSSDKKSDKKSIWVCLECGHFACGGVGLPNTPQSHASRHAKQNHHPCVIKFESPHLRWCFQCDSIIPVEKLQENGDHKEDVFTDILKLIKGKSLKGISMDVEDVWFRSGNVGGGDITKFENSGSQVFDGRGGGYMVKGLSNLGNTCFFNSVMQNLLAVDLLRDNIIKLDRPFGPLTMALKKLFDETSLEADLRNGISPKNLFGCICAKSPQFRGYQQQDSHELLRCLLDGLCTEELGSRKLLKSSGEDESTSNLGTTLVDVIFGGQLSSTVRCMECGQSSVVYEPFLDLSLPVPTKKPSSRKPQAISRSKKTKFPSKKEVKRGGKNQVKGKIDGTASLSQNVTRSSQSKESSSSIATDGGPVKEETVASFDETVASFDETVASFDETVASFDDFAWLDYIGPDTEPNGFDSVSQNHGTSVIQDSDNTQILQMEMVQNGSESQNQILSSKETDLDVNSTCVSSFNDELPLQVQGSEVLLLPYKKEDLTTTEMGSKEIEASSSIVGCEQEDTLELDGLGDLFNEPEMEVDPNTESWSAEKKFQANDMIATGFFAGNSSESDPDIVDDRDAPVSIDTCLTYFTKPELLLSNEHGWHCEHCSKVLQGRLVVSSNSQPKTALETHINGGKLTSQKTLGSEVDASSSDERRSLDNGKPESGIGSTATSETFASQDEKPGTSANYSKRKICPVDKVTDQDLLKGIFKSKDSHPEVSQRDRCSIELNHSPQEVSPAFGHYKSSSKGSFRGQVDESCSANDPDGIESNANQVQSMDTEFSATLLESDESEEVDSKSIKVKRDAIKRILINRAPSILTVHLKRFSQDARGRLSKLSGHVNFRDAIDLRPYIDPRSTDETSYSYRLIGVVEHSGNMRGGHYVAYVRGDKNRGNTDDNGDSKWFYASDAYVREVPLTEVLRCEAYILFYEKI